jgi:hypothetical protein
MLLPWTRMHLEPHLLGGCTGKLPVDNRRIPRPRKMIYDPSRSINIYKSSPCMHLGVISVEPWPGQARPRKA